MTDGTHSTVSKETEWCPAPSTGPQSILGLPPHLGTAPPGPWPVNSLETCSRLSPGRFPGCFCPDSCFLLLNQGPAAGATQLWGRHSFPSVPVCLQNSRAERPGMGWGWLPFVPHAYGLLLSGACWSDAAGGICDPSNCPVGLFSLLSPSEWASGSF